MEYECFSAVLDPLHRRIGIGGVEILHPRLPSRGCDHVFFPKAAWHFESMIFLLPRWDMLIPLRVGGGFKNIFYFSPLPIPGEMIQFA